MAQIQLVALLASRLSLATLIAVMMILWIIMTAQMVSDVNRQEADHKKMMRERPHAAMQESDPRIYSRIRGMFIFNAILEELIALFAIIGALKSHKYLFHTSTLLLTIIWFVAHFRIAELFWHGSGVMIAAHVIHFLVWVTGLVLSYFMSEEMIGKGTKVFGSNSSPA